jgi:hypothetical protein
MKVDWFTMEMTLVGNPDSPHYAPPWILFLLFLGMDYMNSQKEKKFKKRPKKRPEEIEKETEETEFSAYVLRMSVVVFNR